MGINVPSANGTGLAEFYNSQKTFIETENINDTCECTKKDGTRCRKLKKKGNRFCPQHKYCKQIFQGGQFMYIENENLNAGMDVQDYSVSLDVQNFENQLFDSLLL